MKPKPSHPHFSISAFQRFSISLAGFSISAFQLFSFSAFAHFSVDWDVIACGGGSSSGGRFSVQDTLGQSQAETMSGGAISVVAGFWGRELSANTAPTSRNTTASTTANHPLVLFLDKLLARASDPDLGDALTVTAAGPSSAHGPAGNIVLDAIAGTITYTPASGYAGSDSFTYTISDSYGLTVTPTVTVTVTSAGGISLNIVSPPTYSGGTFQVGFAGIPGFEYTIEAAESPTGPWTYLKKVTAGTNGLFLVIDTPAPSVGSRYYRSAYP